MKLLFIWLALFSISLNSYAKDTFILDAEDDWNPYSFKNSHGKAEGFAEDVLKAVADAAGVNFEFRVVSYAKCLDDVTKKTDVVGCFNTARSSANEANFLWPAEKLFKAKVFIWARSDFKESNLKYEHLKAQKVGLTNGYEYGAEFDTSPKEHKIEKDTSTNDQLLFKKLLSNRFNLAVAYEFPAKQVLNSSEMSKEKAGIKSVGVLSDLDLFVSVSKLNPQNTAFIAAYNKGMDVIKKNGIYAGLESKLEQKFK